MPHNVRGDQTLLMSNATTSYPTFSDVDVGSLGMIVRNAGGGATGGGGLAGGRGMSNTAHNTISSGGNHGSNK